MNDLKAAIKKFIELSDENSIQTKPILEAYLGEGNFQKNINGAIIGRKSCAYYKGDKRILITPSIGQGGPSQVPALNFLGSKLQTTNGIYPVLLYYNKLDDADKCLILSYGVSATNKSSVKWPLPNNTKKIGSYFDNVKDKYTPKQLNYQDSYIYKIYKPTFTEEIYDQIVIDVDKLVDYYLKNVIEKTPDKQPKKASEENINKKFWIIPANNSQFRIIDLFKERDVIDWTQKYNYNVGDEIYMYCSTSYQRILFDVEVIKINITESEYINDDQYGFWVESRKKDENNLYSRFKLKSKLEVDDDRLSINKLKEYGLKGNIQGSMVINEKPALLKYIQTVFSDTKESNMEINSFIKSYKERLPQFWEDEMYKWVAIKHFQENWDIDAPNFGEMFKEATICHKNLLASGNYFPIGMILAFAEEDSERTRNMFKVLYDETKAIGERVNSFMSEAESMRKIHPTDWKNHYQDLRAISVYLLFRYPEKYFIYKSRELRKAVDLLSADFSFSSTPDGKFYEKVLLLMNNICDHLKSDNELKQMLERFISEDSKYYDDSQMHVATVDFIFYLGKRYKQEEKAEVHEVITTDETRYWIYAPGENARLWNECQQKGLLLLGWDELGDFSKFDSRVSVISKMKEVYGTDNKTNDGLAVWQFYNDIKIGDVVFVKKGIYQIIGRGIVEGDYVYDETRKEYKSTRKIKWTHVGNWNCPFKLPRKTLTRTWPESEINKQLEDLFKETNPLAEEMAIPFSIKSLIEYIGNTGLLYSDSLIKRFAFSLMSKRFIILSGLSGSGKTQLALVFANALVKNKEEQMCVVSVGADWTNHEPLLGFPNALQEGKYVMPETGVLDLLIEANKEENADRPFFLILDEMNMSYVERYFADFLSAMESGEKISLWNNEDTEENDDVPQKIALPKNLFIIGTINVDETTYMFSPKVLDRANVIEFKISSSEMADFLGNLRDINRDGIVAKAAGMGASFVEIANKKDLAKDDAAVTTLKNYFDELKSVNAEFGYRSATEIFRFICQAKANDDTEEVMKENEILDAAIVQKLLPKLHGSRKKLEPVLQRLWALCFDGADKDLNINEANVGKAKYKESADKIRRMYESANANGFTSFAEA